MPENDNTWQFPDGGSSYSSRCNLIESGKSKKVLLG